MNRPGQSKPKRDKWSSVDRVVDRAMNEMDDDKASLHDFFMYCKRQRPDIFRQMSIERFKQWNDARLAALASQQELPKVSSTMMMANKVLLILIQELGGVPDESVGRLVQLKNALVEDYEAVPNDKASRLMYEELKACAISLGLRHPGELTPAAVKELNAIRANCAKQKVLQ